MKYQQLCPGFELRLLIPFPLMMTETLSVSPRYFMPHDNYQGDNQVLAKDMLTYLH